MRVLCGQPFALVALAPNLPIGSMTGPLRTVSRLKSPLALKPRLVSADFQQALGTRPVARSAHFSVHFAVPSLERPAPVLAKLSTGQQLEEAEPVDEVRTHLRVWRLGLVIPKKMARRSVTRSLIKHQARELWRLNAPLLEQAGWLHDSRPVGNWVLRLKAPWPKADFPSAASETLKQAVRAEIIDLLALCRQGPRGGKA
jgi:ribonuclease P protein component